MPYLSYISLYGYDSFRLCSEKLFFFEFNYRCLFRSVAWQKAFALQVLLLSKWEMKKKALVLVVNQNSQFFIIIFPFMFCNLSLSLSFLRLTFFRIKNPASSILFKSNCHYRIREEYTSITFFFLSNKLWNYITYLLYCIPLFLRTLVLIIKIVQANYTYRNENF